MTPDDVRSQWRLSWWQAFFLFFFGLPGCIGAPFETGSEFEAGPFSAYAYTSGASSSAASSTSTVDPPASSSATSATSSPQIIVTISVTTVTASSASTCGAYAAQCGGMGWTGTHCCEPGLVCSNNGGNVYYSNCINAPDAGDQ